MRSAVIKPQLLDINNWIFKDKTKGIAMKIRCVFLSLMLSLGLSFSASALERFAGIEDGSDENLKGRLPRLYGEQLFKK